MATSKLPKTLGACADLLLQLRAERQAAEAVVAEVKERIQRAEEHTKSLMEAQKTGAARGLRASCSVSSSLVPNVVDWDGVYEYVIKKKDPGLFERRIAVAAWRERLGSKIIVPGIEPFQRVTLHVTALKEKPQ